MAETPITIQKAPKTVKPEEMVLITLSDSPDFPPTGQFIATNGRAFMLKPGVKARVPRALLDVLDDAVQSTPIMDPLTNQVEGWRDTPRFPYKIEKE